MIRNNFTKITALTSMITIVTMNSFTSAYAESSVSYEQAKAEVKKLIDNGNYSFDSSEVKGSSQIKKLNSVLKEEGIILENEDVYCFKVRQESSQYYDFYYGLNSNKIYAWYGCVSGNYRTLFIYDDGNVYAMFEWFRAAGTFKTTLTKYTGWNQMNNKWYYLEDGYAKTGWIQDKEKWYYCYSNGQMASNATIDGYKLGPDGAWIK